MPFMKIRHFSVAVMVVCAGWIGVIAAGAAGADILPVEIGDDSPQIKVDDEGNRSVTIELENKTNAPMTAVVIPARERNDCNFRYSTVLRAGKTGSINVALGNCKESTPLTVEVEGSPAVPLPVTPEEPKVKPEWNRLWQGFGGGLIAGFILVLCAWVWWKRGDGGKPGEKRRLEYIKATWSIKENWATDVSAVAAVFTGFFGTTELVKAYAGAAGEAMLAVSTVAAAIALALVGLTPIVLQATKSYWTKDGTPVSSFTTYGVLSGVMLVLASVFGQLWVIYNTGIKFDLGVSELVLAIPFAIAALLLCYYAVTSLRALLVEGTTKPAPLSPAPDLVGEAARVIARPLWHRMNRNSERELLRIRRQELLLGAAKAAAENLETAEAALEVARKRLADAPEGEENERGKDFEAARDKVRRERSKAARAAAKSAKSGDLGLAEGAAPDSPLPASAYRLAGPEVSAVRSLAEGEQFVGQTLAPTYRSPDISAMI
jgi:hypothetical protein